MVKNLHMWCRQYPKDRIRFMPFDNYVAAIIKWPEREQPLGVMLSKRQVDMLINWLIETRKEMK